MQTWIDDDKPTAELARPRTVTVISLLVGASGIFSYLAAYALTNALTAAGAVAQWPPGEDPRPRRMLICFVTLMMVFGIAAGGFRWISQRQLHSIDRMEED
jgi:hypothetical protein